MSAFSIQDGPRRVISVQLSDIRKVDFTLERIDIYLKPNGLLVLFKGMPEFETFPTIWSEHASPVT